MTWWPPNWKPPRAEPRAGVVSPPRRLPGACGGTHGGSSPSWLQGAGRSPGQAGRGRARSGLRASRDCRDGSVDRPPAGPDGPDARSDGVRPRPQWRGRCASVKRSRHVTSRRRKATRRLWMRPGARDVPRGAHRRHVRGPARRARHVRQIAEAGRSAVDRIPELVRPIDFLLSGMTPNTRRSWRRRRPPALALELWNTQAQRDDGQPALHWPFPIAQESAAHELWDDAMLQQIATDMVRRARDTGALALLPPALAYRAGVHVLHRRIHHGGKAYRRGRRDHRVDRPRAGEIPRVEIAAWRGIPGRRSRPDRVSSRGRNRQG